MMKKHKKLITALSAALFWILLWFFISMAVGHEIILPSPVNVALKLKSLFTLKDYYLSVLFSLIRIVSGLIIGTIVGTFFAVISKRSEIVKALLSPLLSVVRATPVASFILIAFFWIDQEIIPVLISMLMVIPVIFNSVSVGMNSIDKELYEFTYVMRFSFKKKLLHLYIPSVFPSFASGFRTSLGLAWKAGIAAEVICSAIGHGIGSSLEAAKRYLETTELFAWTVTVIIISMILEKIFDKITNKIILRYSGLKGESSNEA